MSWLKDGQPVDTRVNIRNSHKDSIIFIRSAQREDSGIYEMAVKVDSFEDKATIALQIVGEAHMLVPTRQQHTLVHMCACSANVSLFQTPRSNLLYMVVLLACWFWGSCLDPSKIQSVS